MPWPTTTTRLMRRPPRPGRPAPAGTAHTLNSGIPETGSRRVVGQQVGAELARPVERQEDGVRADRTGHRGRRDQLTAGGRDAHGVALGDAVGVGEQRGAARAGGPGAASTSSATLRVCAPDW